MTSSVSSSPSCYSPPSSPELIKTITHRRSYHIEIGLVILFLCLTIPSLFFLTLIYRRQSTTFLPTTNSTTAPSPAIPEHFHRRSLASYPQARCMDESVASYYVRLATNTHSRWLIYFDGGWFCYSKESCHFRRIYSPNLISSTNFNEEKSLIGVFSSFRHYNIIYVPYCSSDLWSGSSNTSHSHGYDIFHAVFDDLHREERFRKAKQILFTGFSAGGLGLLLNLPQLFPRFSAQIDLRVIIDSAWFIDYPGSSNGVSKINEGLLYWNAQISPSCQATPKYKCLLGSEAIRLFPSHVSILIIQSLFDQTQLQLDDFTVNSEDFSSKLTANLRQSSARVSVFAPACAVHGFLYRPVWSQFDIEQRTLASVLNLWLRRKKRTRLQLIDQRFDSSFCPQREDQLDVQP